MCTDNYIKSIDVYSEVKVLVSDLATPWTVACEAPRSMGFSRQEYWRGLPFPASRRLPSPGIKPRALTSPALAGGFFTTVPGKPNSEQT